MTTIRLATKEDADAIARIYNHYVLDTVVTFEETAVDVQAMTERMAAVASASLPWLVAVEDGAVVGYAYAARWHARSAYRFSAESTVYLDPAAQGRGIGSRLYGALLPMLDERGMHAVIGGIALPNERSVALHEKFGFVKVSHFSQVGFKFGRWLDVGHWQKV